MNKLQKRLKEIKDKKYTLISYDSKFINYMDRNGYKFHKSIYNKDELNNKHKYDIKNPYCCENIDLMLLKSGTKTKLIPTSYKGASSVATFICGGCGKSFKCCIGNLEKYKYKLCYECTRAKQDIKKNEIEIIKNEVLEYGYMLIGDYQSTHARIDVCDKSGYKGKVKLDTLRKGGGISKFALYNPYALDNLKLFCKLNGFTCTIPNQKYQGWEKPLKVKCDCGNIYKIDTSKLVNGLQYRCPRCARKQSNLESIVKKWLNNYNIQYIEQYKFEDCKYKKPLPFDFYLPQYNTLIEVQGEQHYKPVQIYGGTRAFEQQQKRDKIKQQYCKYNNIQLILLSYQDIRNNNFGNILLSYLNI